MKRSVLFLTGLFFFLNGNAQYAGVLETNIITENPDTINAFPIVDKGGAATPVYYDTADFPGVIRAIGDLQNDVDSVTGVKPESRRGGPLKEKGYAILVGTLGKSKQLAELVAFPPLR